MPLRKEKMHVTRKESIENCAELQYFKIAGKIRGGRYFSAKHSRSQGFIAIFTIETLYVLRNSVVFSGYNWQLFDSHFACNF